MLAIWYTIISFSQQICWQFAVNLNMELKALKPHLHDKCIIYSIQCKIYPIRKITICAKESTETIEYSLLRECITSYQCVKVCVGHCEQYTRACAVQCAQIALYIPWKYGTFDLLAFWYYKIPVINPLNHRTMYKQIDRLERGWNAWAWARPDGRAFWCARKHSACHKWVERQG